MNIQFSPPDISKIEIAEVTQALESGWITTGPKTKLFEKKIAEYCGNPKAVCLNSATACLEMALRILGIGEGDEVIVPAYTYTASASVVYHVGATIRFIDTEKDKYTLDYSALEAAINENTKAIIPVDIGGVMCDYDRILQIVKNKKSVFNPKTDIQKAYGRVIIIADAAHSFGASYHGRRCGSTADFTSFSFHAVKNLTTAEGGALTWLSHEGIDSEELYKKLMLWTLHGQSKDALNKMKLGAWEYDIVYPAFKCNMTDITAAIGLGQLARFDGLIAKRKRIYDIYNKELKEIEYEYLCHEQENNQGNYHLYLARIKGISEEERNKIISEMAENGIACNVHFKPLPMMTAYKKLGYKIADYPNAYNQYANEITLPMHTLLNETEATQVSKIFKKIINGTKHDNKKSESTIIVERIWPDEYDKLDFVKKTHADCGEKMFLESGLLHWADTLPMDYWERLAMEKELYLIKTREGKKIGFFDLTFEHTAYFEVNKKAVFVGKIAVTPSQQQKKYGWNCMNWIRDYAISCDCKSIQTTAYNKSSEAVRFLTNYGFSKLYERATKHFIVDCFELSL